MRHLQELKCISKEVKSASELAKQRISRILTTDFPMYFALVSRVKHQVEHIGPEGGMMTYSDQPQVQAAFPESSLQKKIKIALQVHTCSTELLVRMFGSRIIVSPVITIEPRRRKVLTLCSRSTEQG